MMFAMDFWGVEFLIFDFLCESWQKNLRLLTEIVQPAVCNAGHGIYEGANGKLIPTRFLFSGKEPISVF